MGDLIKVVFGKGGGRTDKKLPHDLNRASQMFETAVEMETTPATVNIIKQMYEEVLRIDPNFCEAMNNLATIKRFEGDIGGAIKLLKDALKIRPHDAQVLYNLGSMHLMMEDVQDALESLTLAIKYAPRMTEAHFNIALAYEMAGLYDTAKIHWRKVLELNPNDPSIKMVKCRLGIDVIPQRT